MSTANVERSRKNAFGAISEPDDCRYATSVGMHFTMKNYIVTPAESLQTRLFIGTSVSLFLISAATTILWCSAMPAMSEMPLHGHSWTGNAASFLGMWIVMWIVMMVAMMLPSLAPMLWRYREAVRRTDDTRLGWLTILVGTGYFFVWTVIGMAVFVLGEAAAAIETRLPALTHAVPIAVGVVVLLAGAFQFTRWKAHHLACCRAAPARRLSPDTGTAWRHGLRLGRHCSYCCGNLMAILVVTGMMDLRAMAIVTAAMTAERLAPASDYVVRATGAAVVGAGLYLIVAAIWPG